MAGKNLLYIGAGILFLIGICLVGYGILNVIGSTSAQGSANWLTFGLGFGIVGRAVPRRGRGADLCRPTRIQNRRLSSR